jgi:hypothetical protein
VAQARRIQRVQPEQWVSWPTRSNFQELWPVHQNRRHFLAALLALFSNAEQQDVPLESVVH